jgi:hypothetical protein
MLSGQIFAHIGNDIPNTNNKIEGGINARLKELRRCHRGVSIEHEKKLFDWVLWSKSEDPKLKNLIKNHTFG